MKKAERTAMLVMNDIDPMLNSAFEPVYSGIPSYMEFHYSLAREWLELSERVLGQMEGQLNQYLFAGLDSRIGNITARLQSDFDRIWFASIEDSFATGPEADGPISELAKRSVGNARDRIKTTATVYGALGASGSALLIVPRIVASKLGQRIAGKIAVKTGARWVTVAGGAGSGAALCSWAGPGAAAYAVAGAVISWVGVDYAMIKLDEHVSREEFEQDLTALIDEQKAAVRRVLEDTIAAKLLRTQTERKIVVKEISLSELPDYDRRAACEAAGEISGQYIALIENLRDRSPRSVEALSELIAQYQNNRLLAPWVDSIERDISNADLNIMLNGGMNVKVQLPPDLQNGRQMRAAIELGDLSMRSDWIKPNSYGNFVFRMPVSNRVPLIGQQKLILKLEQDRGLRGRNRTLKGEATFLPYRVLPDLTGLSVVGEVTVSTWTGIDRTDAPRVAVEIPVSGADMEKADTPEFCTI